MLNLRSSDGVTFEVDEVVARESQTITSEIENNGAENEIPLLNVKSEILSKVIEYCKKHVEYENNDELSDDELKAWDLEFVKVDKNTLFDLMMAAHYLKIKSLVDLTCQTVADMIKGKTPDEIKQILNIKKDMSPEEEKDIRRENAWAFE